MYKILLVEDDSQIREVITDFFLAKSQGQIELHIARDGNEGLQAVYENEYDLCMLDVMLPGASGFEICRAIRENSIVPITNGLSFIDSLNTERFSLRQLSTLIF